jgi:hypothetical protein
MSTLRDYKMDICDICGNEHSESTKSCAPCQEIISKYKKRSKNTKRYKTKLRAALTQRCDKEKSKGDERYFKCVYTDISSKFNTTKKGGLDPLEDALVLDIDHENPKDRENSNLVVSLHLVNYMKNKLPPDKFKEIVILLGKKFAKEIEQEDFENQFKRLVGSA